MAISLHITHEQIASRTLTQKERTFGETQSIIQRDSGNSEVGCEVSEHIEKDSRSSLRAACSDKDRLSYRNRPRNSHIRHASTYLCLVCTLQYKTHGFVLDFRHYYMYYRIPRGNFLFRSFIRLSVIFYEKHIYNGKYIIQHQL